MGKYKNKAYSLRIDENIMNEITRISEIEHRTKNKQIELVLEKFVEEYKAKETKQQERAETKNKLYQSKIG